VLLTVQDAALLVRRSEEAVRVWARHGIGEFDLLHTGISSDGRGLSRTCWRRKARCRPAFGSRVCESAQMGGMLVSLIDGFGEPCRCPRCWRCC
jgi:hypothetical protein